jgi:hypothetical protein
LIAYKVNRQDLITVGKRSVCATVPNEIDVEFFARLAFIHMIRIEHEVPRPT